MHAIINHFKKLSKTKRCSYEADEAFEFLKKYAKECGCSVYEDEAKNIVATKGNPKLYLQSHYDMVCIGQTPPEVIEKDGFLSAKNSTLGADNGIGIAMMMEFMKKKQDLGYIFTADEEVGLKGAANLDIDFNGDYLINLDYETEGEICLGCAGGFDISARLPVEIVEGETLRAYHIKSANFTGGHSGIDIGRKNAIKELAKLINQKNIHIVDIKGGEKTNAIPKNAEALVITQGTIGSSMHFGIEREQKANTFIKNSDTIIRFLNAIHDGILGYDKKLDSVTDSFNIGKIAVEDGFFVFEGMGRSNNSDNLSHLSSSVKILLEQFGFTDIHVNSFFPPWDVKTGRLEKKALHIFEDYFKHPKTSIIHAGLECGILNSRFKECISIGPNIFNAHTTEEKVEIDSIKKTFAALEKLIKELSDD